MDHGLAVEALAKHHRFVAVFISHRFDVSLFLLLRRWELELLTLQLNLDLQIICLAGLSIQIKP